LFQRSRIRLIRPGLSVTGVSVRIMQLRYAFHLDPTPGQRIALARAFGVRGWCTTMRSRRGSGRGRRGRRFPLRRCCPGRWLPRRRRPLSGVGWARCRQWCCAVAAGRGGRLPELLRLTEQSPQRGAGGGAPFEVPQGQSAVGPVHRERALEDHVWTKTADEILERLAGCLKRIPDSGHLRRARGPTTRKLVLPTRSTPSQGFGPARHLAAVCTVRRPCRAARAAPRAR
jgi:hypothetical protein